MELKDKVIIITGGCQGLGRAMGEYLAAKGAKLALVDLNQEKLDDAVAACKAAGGDARYWACHCADLTLQHTFRLFPDATGESMGPSGGHHTETQAWLWSAP